MGQHLWPQWDRLALWRGASLLKSGRVEFALIYLENQLKRYPMNGELYGLAGRAAQALGCFELARTRFVFASAHLPEKVEPRIELGLHCVRHGRAEDAESIFRPRSSSIRNMPFAGTI